MRRLTTYWGFRRLIATFESIGAAFTQSSNGMASCETKTSDPAANPKAAEEESWGIVGYGCFTDRARFNGELEKLAVARGRPTLIVSGGATSLASLAKEWARSQSIPFAEHLPVPFTVRERLASNSLIVRDSTLTVAFLSAKGRGALDTIKEAEAAGKPVITITID
jgi:hypothetical protein